MISLVLLLVVLLVVLLVILCTLCILQETAIVERFKSRIHNIKVKIVNTEEPRRRGLMNRKSVLRSDEGMLFVFPRMGGHMIWMKKTYIPLDVIFFSDKNEVVGYVENTIPHSLESRGINRSSSKFLEVNSGYVKKNKVDIGDIFTFIEIGELLE